MEMISSQSTCLVVKGEVSFNFYLHFQQDLKQKRAGNMDTVTCKCPGIYLDQAILKGGNVTLQRREQNSACQKLRND